MKLHSKYRIILSTILVLALLAVQAPSIVMALAEVKSTAGRREFGFNDGAADQALFNVPYGLAVNNDNGLIIVDSFNNKIRLLKDKQITTLAGCTDKTDASGLPIGGFADGVALEARFNHPRGVAVDAKGNIYISDSGNNSIRIIANQKVYTLAGTAVAGYADEKGRKAQFNLPSGITIDSENYLYVADTLNNVIRRISPSGEVTTFAGYYSKEGGYLDGAAKDALFNEPSDVAVDKEGTVYVLDSGNQLIRKIKGGVVSTIAGICSDKIPNTPYALGGFQNGGSDKAMFNFPMGIDVAEDGTIFIADTWNHRIRVIKLDGSVGTLAGSGIPGLVDENADQAQFNGPADVSYHNGTLYISDMWNNGIRSMDLSLDKLSTIVDRNDIEEAYRFIEATDETQVWFEGGRIKYTIVKPYKDGNKIYVPMKNIFKAWGAEVKWLKKNQILLVKKQGFRKIFRPGVDMTFMKQGYVYIDTESLSQITNLRIEWFPIYNALVIEGLDSQ